MEQDQEFWNLMGFALASENRRKVMFCLNDGHATPKQISDDCGLRIGHVSNILIALKTKGLVICRNPEAKRGRVYSLTEIGEAIVESIEEVAKSRSRSNRRK